MRQVKITKLITNTESIVVDKYFEDISKEVLINQEEEVALAKRIKLGDKDAEDKLVKANLRFVVSVAKKYQYNGLPLADLINEGNLGLIKAAKKFDETKEFKFISYAVWWIRQQILEALNEQTRLVRLPLNQVSYLNKMSKESEKFEVLFERPPSDEELSELIDMNLEKVVERKNFEFTYVRGDAQTNIEEESSSYFETYYQSDEKSDDKVKKESLRTEILRLLATLNPQQRKIISEWFNLEGKGDFTTEQIAEINGVTRERVRQVKEKALRNLKKVKDISHLREYLK